MDEVEEGGGVVATHHLCPFTPGVVEEPLVGILEEREIEEVTGVPLVHRGVGEEEVGEAQQKSKFSRKSSTWSF